MVIPVCVLRGELSANADSIQKILEKVAPPHAACSYGRSNKENLEMNSMTIIVPAPAPAAAAPAAPAAAPAWG